MAHGKASIDGTFLLLGLGLGVGLLLAKARKSAAAEKVKPDAPDPFAKQPPTKQPPAQQPAKQPQGKGTGDALTASLGDDWGVQTPGKDASTVTDWGSYGGGGVDTGKVKEPGSGKGKTDWGSAIQGGGRAFAEGLSDFAPMRDEKILAAIQSGFHPPLEWTWIDCSGPGKDGVHHTCKVAVLDRPIAVGTANDFVRVTVLHPTAQRIADHFGCLLPTTKICDLAYQQAHVEIPFMTQSSTKKELDEMATTRAMLKQHDFIEQQRAGRTGLLRPIGKEWIIANKLSVPANRDRAIQYGWHGRSTTGQPAPKTGPGGAKVNQPADLTNWYNKPVTPHDIQHTDYSSATTLVQPMGYVDGVIRPLEAILGDPAVASLLSHEGVMTVFRHPAVPAPGQANV